MLRKLCLPIGLLVLGGVALSSIERLTLREMVEKTDGAVFGKITSSHVTAVPVFDGAEEIYFTTLVVSGTSVLSGEPETVSVSFPGGFVDGERGVFNSEAPSQDDVRVGNEVVVFYKWSDNMGGGFASNALYASHGGLFRTFESRNKGVVVQGRGTGYAVPSNRRIGTLESQARQARLDHIKNKRK